MGDLLYRANLTFAAGGETWQAGVVKRVPPEDLEAWGRYVDDGTISLVGAAASAAPDAPTSVFGPVGNPEPADVSDLGPGLAAAAAGFTPDDGEPINVTMEYAGPLLDPETGQPLDPQPVEIPVDIDEDSDDEPLPPFDEEPSAEAEAPARRRKR